jgi:hypothetical protein
MINQSARSIVHMHTAYCRTSMYVRTVLFCLSQHARRSVADRRNLSPCSRLRLLLPASPCSAASDRFTRRMRDFAADNRQRTLTVGRSTNQQPGQISPLLSAIAYPVPAKLSERPEQRRDRLEVGTPLALGPLLAGSKGGMGRKEQGMMAWASLTPCRCLPLPAILCLLQSSFQRSALARWLA